MMSDHAKLSRMRKITPILIAFMIGFSPLMMIILDDSKALPLYPAGYHKIVPTGDFTEARRWGAGASYGTSGNLEDKDGVNCNANPSSSTAGYVSEVMTGRYISMLPEYLNITNYTDAEITITSVYATVIQPDPWMINGWLSVGWYTGSGNPVADTPWLTGVDDIAWMPVKKPSDNEEWSYMDSTHPEYGKWYNSTLWNSALHSDDMVTTFWGWGHASPFTYRLWDITSLFEWNISLITSPNLYVMYTFPGMDDGYLFDYVGLIYLTVNETFIPDTMLTGTDRVMFGFIWLIILFFPAIAMSTVIPRLGFVAGMALMLIILGLSQYGFYPVTVLGLITLGILVYKGE